MCKFIHLYFVESIGSVLKHQNKVRRNLTTENLHNVLVIWNGPSIPHCDKVVDDTLDRMFADQKWHFVRTTGPEKLKFYKVLAAVDHLQEGADPYYF